MNKQELIEEIKNLENYNASKRTWVNRGVVLELVEELDEPQKVTVPQIVADYIEYAKENDWDLQDAIDSDIIANKEDRKFYGWFYKDNNIETLARAWLDGYETEEEKRYIVKIIGITNCNSYLNYHKGENKWTIESRIEIYAIRTKHTRKELEEAGFGWVFDCPGIEIEEVKE